MNILVISDNKEILDRARPIFERRKVNRWTFTSSDDINPKKDYNHIIKYYDLVFSLHCKKIFPKYLTDSVRCVNIHPGFNPYNRGLFPHVFSIVNGLPAGATIHLMDEGIDTGPIIIQKEVKVLPNDTSTSLYKRVLSAELDILDISLEYILTKTYVLTHVENHDYHYNSMEDYKHLCEFSPIDSGPFSDIFNKLRALSHAGYMNAHMDGIKFKLIIHDGDTEKA